MFTISRHYTLPAQSAFEKDREEGIAFSEPEIFLASSCLMCKPGDCGACSLQVELIGLIIVTKLESTATEPPTVTAIPGVWPQ
jgi:hypothetical protein